MGYCTEWKRGKWIARKLTKGEVLPYGHRPWGTLEQAQARADAFNEIRRLAGPGAFSASPMRTAGSPGGRNA